MMSNRRFSPMRGLAAFVFTFGLVCSAAGQTRLDPSFFANDSIWSPQEQDTAALYVRTQLDAIQSEDATEASLGRKNLVDALTTSGAAERFVEQFSGVITQYIDPLVSSESLAIRVNAMVICNELRHPDALAPIQKGLLDSNAGVRFTAAKAANSLLVSDQLTERQAEELIGQIAELIVAEDEVHVVSQLFTALLEAGDNARVLVVLNRRVPWHDANPFSSYEPERIAMQSVFSEMFVAAPADRDADQVRQLAQASARYMKLASDQLVSGEAPDANVNRSRSDIVLVASSSLSFAHTELRIRAGVPITNPERLIQQQNWAGLVTLSSQWYELLQGEPVNMTDEELSVAAAE